MEKSSCTRVENPGLASAPPAAVGRRPRNAKGTCVGRSLLIARETYDVVCTAPNGHPDFKSHGQRGVGSGHFVRERNQYGR